MDRRQHDKEPVPTAAQDSTHVVQQDDAAAPATAAAARAVLGVQEIFESILLELDMRTLLLAQRVSRRWRDTIATSRPIQRALFFLPERAESVKHLTERRERNPLLAEVFAPWFPEEQEGDDGIGCIRWQRDQGNPFVQLFGGPKPRRRRRAGEQPAGEGEEEEDGDKRMSAERREAFLRKGASWRRMLVQQPACEMLGLVQQSGGSGQQSFTTAQQEFLLPGSSIKTQKKQHPGPSWRQPIATPGDSSSSGSSQQTKQEEVEAASSSGSAADDVHAGGGVRMGALYDLVYRFMGYSLSDSIMYKVLWRRPAKEAPLCSWYWKGGGCMDAVQLKFNPEVGIVVMQYGQMPGFSFEFRRNKYTPMRMDKGLDRLRKEWRCEGYEEEMKPVTLDFAFGQDWFG